MSRDLNVFYSWSSDNKNIYDIKEAIRKAIESLNQNSGDIQLKYQEATREVPGSPNIVSAIKNKILSSSIFICDLTPSFENNGKSFPNSNVVFEYGFAMSVLGEERCIAFVDKSCSKQNVLSSLPFDIAQNRTSKIDGSSITSMTKDFEYYIDEILKHDPVMPFALNREKFNDDINTAKNFIEGLKLEDYISSAEFAAQNHRFDNEHLKKTSTFEDHLAKPETLFHDNDVQKYFEKFKNAFFEFRSSQAINFSPCTRDINIFIIEKPVGYVSSEDYKKIYLDKVYDYAECVNKLADAYKDFRIAIKNNLLH